MDLCLSNRSNQASPTREASYRRPRSSFEDASLSTDAKVNVSLSEKHLHTDRNALDCSNDVPNPIHSYIRNHPYYRLNCKSRAPITSLNQKFNLQSVLVDDVCIKSQPLATMFANMPKFDVVPNLADNQDFMYSYDVPMPAADRSVDSPHSSVIDNDIAMAYSAPTVNSNSRINGNTRSYAAVAAAPPSHLFVSKECHVPHLNASNGSINSSKVFFDSKKGASILKKSVSCGTARKPPLQNYKLHLLPSVPEAADELDIDTVDSAGDLKDSDIELVDACCAEDGSDLDSSVVGSADYEYLDLAPLHFRWNYNSKSVQMCHFMIPTVLDPEMIAGLVGFGYLAPEFMALQQVLESYLGLLARTLDASDAVMPALRCVDAVVDSSLQCKSVPPADVSLQQLLQLLQGVGVVPDFDDYQKRLALLTDKPSQQLTVEEDLLLFEAQESKECESQQTHTVRAVIDDMDDANINEYGDLDVTAAFVAEAINNNCIDEFNCMVCDIEVMDSALIADLKLKRWFPYVNSLQK